jgi:hypothetical protein
VPTLTRQLDHEEAESHVAKLCGKEVSRTWLGYAAALFLEFGELRPSETSGNLRGEATIMLDTAWRHGIGGIELTDRNDDDSDIEQHLEALADCVIEAITIYRHDFSLELEITGGRWIRSPGCRWDQSPSWSIFLGDGRWIKVADGTLCIERGVESLDTGETV